jgi:hypothetical protein
VLYQAVGDMEDVDACRKTDLTTWAYRRTRLR